MSILLELTVGERVSDTAASVVSLTEADHLTHVAHEVGVTGIRLVDSAPGAVVVDPSITAAYLAGRYPGLGFLVDAPTTHNSPYNLARRILSLDRSTDGRAGVVLRTGRGDEVSDAVTPRPPTDDPARRHREYAQLLAALWESFPRDALRGDQERAVVADDALIRPVHHQGSFYRVAGPLDGPSSVQGRPVLAVVAADPVDLGNVLAIADVVITDLDTAPAAVSAAADVAGRTRTDIAVLARTVTVDDPQELSARASRAGVDGWVVAPTGDARTVHAAIRRLEDLQSPDSGGTLRSLLGLPQPATVTA
ncbi:LLM class flavin-dependent oxidoreductase [Williamsia sterculiae]|uniref:Flavin-dependent oxidoreductase, luciferase family (Includes alkanesulfonate monooxygenase SsuD and methylene tetrahydromethanopterin reductase) n=1 Tax=Williamsia sterculiae TaxID=1344003 RepID=A0A1N7D0V9_9NOCA|nr:LLM class flavin-dependent oxidoreductase [Williamsia sterculiae]SIR69473.1 Flavin-dependent oxidoreductase, luciferase family (includes alkanesulfonate monooxygenase SsuD and methylene tetrahydromethanopterin reductase) [Williamsia sterculiae]